MNIKRFFKSKSWKRVIHMWFDFNECDQIEKNLALKSEGKIVYPALDRVFAPYNFTEFVDTKVVIIGQDPYPNGIADGLAFSQLPGTKLSPTLRNILKEAGVETDSVSLLNWANQGVLLLNSSLTVEADNPNSHQNLGWDVLIRRTLAVLSQKKRVVFMLWGKRAQSFKESIEPECNLILEAPHPSPLSAHRGFFGCKHFQKANEFLQTQGVRPINWEDI